jgi:tetratricopeptide (TPR) repeat protein
MPEAIGGLEACLVCEPTNTNVMFFLAQIYAQMGRYADAEALFQRGLTLEPRNVDAMLLLASVFARTGRYQDSSVMLNRILKAEGNAEVKSEARELFALVSKTYRDIVDLTKTGIKAKLGTAEYVDKRLLTPRELLDKAKTTPLTPDERATLQEMVDRLVLDNNYLLQNGMFQSEAVQKRYNDGLKALVDELQKL